MKCRAITGDPRSNPGRCPYAAIEDGLCRVHLKARRELPDKITRLERAIQKQQQRLAQLAMPPALENPS